MGVKGQHCLLLFVDVSKRAVQWILHTIIAVSEWCYPASPPITVAAVSLVSNNTMARSVHLFSLHKATACCPAALRIIRLPQAERCNVSDPTLCETKAMQTAHLVTVSCLAMLLYTVVVDRLGGCASC